MGVAGCCSRPEPAEGTLGARKQASMVEAIGSLPCELPSLSVGPEPRDTWGLSAAHILGQRKATLGTRNYEQGRG